MNRLGTHKAEYDMKSLNLTIVFFSVNHFFLFYLRKYAFNHYSFYSLISSSVA